MASGLENEFVALHEIVKAAKIRLNANIWDYLIGGTETETTLRRNRMALDSIAFRPRVLRDVSKIDPSSEILGRKIRLPVMLALPLALRPTCRTSAAYRWRRWNTSISALSTATKM